MNQLLLRLVVKGATKYSGRFNTTTTTSSNSLLSLSNKRVNGVKSSSMKSCNNIGTNSILFGYKRLFSTFTGFSKEEEEEIEGLEEYRKKKEAEEKVRLNDNALRREYVDRLFGVQEKIPNYYELLMQSKTIKDRMEFARLQKIMLKFAIKDPVTMSNEELEDIKSKNQKLYESILAIRKYFPEDPDEIDEDKTIDNDDDDDLEAGKFDVNLRDLFTKESNNTEDDIKIDYAKDTYEVIREKIEAQQRKLDKLTLEDIKRSFNRVSNNPQVQKIKDMLNSGKINLSVFSSQDIEYFQKNFSYELAWLELNTLNESVNFDEVPLNKREHDPYQLPFNDAARHAEKLLKRYLNEFFKLVHPDFFYNNIDQRTQNQKSLAQLNSILRILDEYIKRSQDTTDTTKLDKMPPQSSLSFYSAAEDGGPTSLITQNLLFDEPSKDILTSRMELITYTTELRFSVYKQIFELFKKSGINILVKDLEDINKPNPNEEIYDDPWEDYFKLPDTKKSPIQVLQEVLDLYPMAGEDMAFTDEHKALLDSFDDNRVFFYFDDNIKGDLDVLRGIGLRDVAEEQLVHLKTNLMAIEYKEWMNLPILIASPQFLKKLRSAMSPHGFIVLERNFDPVETLNYIKNQVPDIKRKFESLVNIATHNRTVLEDATINLELLLNGGTVVVENLFTINKRSLEKVKDLFNESMSQLGELKIPTLQFLDQTKSLIWKQLPKTKFDLNEFGQWKMENLSTTPTERLELIADIEQRNQSLHRTLPIPKDVEQRTNSTLEKINSLVNLKDDKRDVPLELIDRNTFDVLQSSPYLNSTMDAVTRLSNLVSNPIKVPFFNQTQSAIGSTSTSQSPIITSIPTLTGINATTNTEKKQQVKELDIFNRPNIAAINVDLKVNISPKYINTFDQIFGTTSTTDDSSSTPENNNNTNENTGEDNNNNVEQSRSSIEDILSGKTTAFKPTPMPGLNLNYSLMMDINKSSGTPSKDNTTTSTTTTTTSDNKKTIKEKPEQIEYLQQKLSDFNWNNINLIISDRYQFIMTDDFKHGFCFIPNNFVDTELFLFLNSIQDSFDKIHGIDRTVDFDLADTVHDHLLLEKLVNKLKIHYGIPSIKIDNNAVYNLDSVLAYLRYLEQALSNNKTLSNALPYCKLVISNQFRVSCRDNSEIATISLKFTDRHTADLFNLIRLNLAGISDKFAERLGVSDEDVAKYREDLHSKNLKINS